MHEKYITTAKQIPEFSIVKTEDGQTGILTNVKKNKPLILLDDSSKRGRTITRDTKLELVLFPAQLASQWMRRNGFVAE